MKILITGSAGFVGTHLHKALKERYEVDGIDTLSVNNSASIKRNSYFQNTLQGSVHSDFITSLKEKPNLLIHLAAETGISGSLNNPALYFHQNVQGTFNALEECRRNGVKYLIYASSSSVYEPNQAVMTEDSPHDKQLSFYGTSKRMAEIMVENYCKQFGLVAIGLRFFTVYGSWTRPDMAAYKFMSAINQENPIILYNNGEVLRDFTHVSDVVYAIDLLTQKIIHEQKGTHQVYNIGFGEPVSVKEYAAIIANNLGKELRFIHKPLPINELASTHSDCLKLEKYIGFRPQCEIGKGIQEMTTWYKSFKY